MRSPAGRDAVAAAAAALPERDAMTGLGVLVCAYTVATLLPWRRAAAVLGACALAHAAGGAAVTAAGGELRLLLIFWGVDGHDLSAIVVQAGAADRLVDRDATAAKATLASIRRQGRETLTALRQLVGVMRDSDEAGPRAPQPTLARLDELVAGAREGGMAVETTWSGHGRPLPPTVDLAAYRIVQEALTNARRHAPGAAVSVAVAVDDSGARVVVANGPPGNGSGTASGRRPIDPCRDRVQAVVYAYEHGVVTSGEDPTGRGADRGEEGRR